MYVCVCKGITDNDVRRLGHAGVTCPKKLAATLKIDDEENCCGRCMNNLADFVQLATEARSHHRTNVETS